VAEGGGGEVLGLGGFILEEALRGIGVGVNDEVGVVEVFGATRAVRVSHLH